MEGWQGVYTYSHPVRDRASSDTPTPITLATETGKQRHSDRVRHTAGQTTPQWLSHTGSDRAHSGARLKCATHEAVNRPEACKQSKYDTDASTWHTDKMDTLTNSSTEMH